MTTHPLEIHLDLFYATAPNVTSSVFFVSFLVIFLGSLTSIIMHVCSSQFSNNVAIIQEEVLK
jgi:hypothetical protein